MFSIEEHTNALAAYLPNGYTFEAKNIDRSNLRALLQGFAFELFLAQGYIQTLEDEYFPDRTILYLSEWEQALGLPDDCFTIDSTNANRLLQIIVKLAHMNLEGTQDYVDLAALFGVTITATPGLDTIDVIDFDSITTARFTIVIEFPLSTAPAFTYDYPIIFGSLIQIMIRCLFERQKPANVNLLFA